MHQSESMASSEITFERHFSVKELSALWGMSDDFIRRLFLYNLALWSFVTSDQDDASIASSAFQSPLPFVCTCGCGPVMVGVLMDEDGDRAFTLLRSGCSYDTSCMKARCLSKCRSSYSVFFLPAITHTATVAGTATDRERIPEMRDRVRCL